MTVASSAALPSHGREDLAGESAVPALSDRAFAVDAAAIAAVSTAICLASDRLLLMTAVVPALLALRFAAWRRLPAGERGATLGSEAVFFAACTVLGAFNDWNSVVRHRIYDYTVPHWFPELSTIPLWMLLYWGMILRFFATLARWERLRPPVRLADTVYVGHRSVRAPWLRIVLLVLLVLVTRQFIYRYYLHPVLSWAPFAAALLAYAALFRLDRHDRALVLVFLIGGPAIEILYIQVGHLHRYHLGWLAGVPLWITLWWVLAVLVWKDISARLQRALAVSGGSPVHRSAASAGI